MPIDCRSWRQSRDENSSSGISIAESSLNPKGFTRGCACDCEIVGKVESAQHCESAERLEKVTFDVNDCISDAPEDTPGSISDEGQIIPEASLR